MRTCFVQILQICLLAATLLLTACTSETPPETLRVLAWPGYADADLVAEFERKHKVKVTVTVVTSDDELWSRLSANQGRDFDLFAVNTAELKRYIDSGLSVPLDLSAIPNIAHQLPRFRDHKAIPGLTRLGTVHAIPYTFSEMGLIYDKTRVFETPVSMEAMWDPRYQGKVLAYDASSHNFTLAALLLGAPDPFRLDDAQFNASVKKLMALRRNVLTFYSTPEEAVELSLNNNVALIFGNYGNQQLKQLQEAGIAAGYVIPQEGALAWLDCWAISRGARNSALAHAWINYMLETPVSHALTERQGLANTLQPALEPAEADRIRWLQPVEDVARRAQLWDKIRSGDRNEQASQ